MLCTTHQFHARTQDPQTATWTTQDTWRGLLNQPQTLNRYNYVTNNPTTLTDYMGYFGIGIGSGMPIMRVMPRLPAPNLFFPPAPAPALPLPWPPIQPQPPRTPIPFPAPKTPAKASQDQLTEQHRDWFHSGEYSYHLKNWLGVNLGQYSTASIAKVFREHPAEIFPFPIEGCSSFTDGASCRLVDALGQLAPFGDGSGTVRVRTSESSVTFTVTSDDYFDAPGSTIRFDIVKRQDGYYLDQTAKASGANVAVASSINLVGAQQIPWAVQAANLRQAVLKYGEK